MKSKIKRLIVHWKPTPISKAKNAYDLLKDVQKVILAEPKRYNQGYWGENLRDHGTPSEVRKQIREHNLAFSLDKLPDCGTIACVAGWIHTLRRLPGDIRFCEYAAQEQLGVDTFKLFKSSALATDALSGTLAYAKAGVKHIQKFMDDHEDELKANLLDPIERTVNEDPPTETD